MRDAGTGVVFAQPYEFRGHVVEQRLGRSPEADRRELEQFENDWMQAVQDRDRATLERLVANGFRFTAIHLHPDPIPRDSWMEAAMTGYTIVSFHFMSTEIDLFGETAVVHARYSQVAHFNNVDLSNVFRLTDVWSRLDDRWQVVARHSTMLG